MASPSDIEFDVPVMDLDFHPHRDVLAANTVAGDVRLFTYSSDGNKAALRIQAHTESCRSAKFSPDGTTLYTVGADRAVCAFDANGKLMWKDGKTHTSSVNALHIMGPNFFASGDDEGTIHIWDVRTRGSVLSFSEHTDFVSALTTSEDVETMLSTGGDGRLGAYALRKGKVQEMSDEQEDELLSLAVLKHGKKVAVGTQEGVVALWSWGRWTDMDDRLVGHPQSVDALLKVDEDTVLTGSSDGIIRIVSILPNKLLGVLGEHGDMPIERLAYTRDRAFVGSVSHDQRIKFWPAAFLFEEGGDDDDDGEGAAGPSAAGTGAGDAAIGGMARLSDDDDSDSDEEIGGGGPASRIPKNDFYDDL